MNGQTVHAWRIVKAKYAASAMTGEGAKQFGGRWNNPGRAVVYGSGSRSLAALEMLTRLLRDQLLAKYVLLEIRCDHRFIETLDPKSLPRNWNSEPVPAAVRLLGDQWLKEARSLVLRVPSAVIAAESNYLINPNHSDFRRVWTGPPEPFRFDQRLAQ